MPTSTGARASTQDTSTGTLVAQATNEVHAGDVLQVMIPEGNKTSYSETSRTGLTAADAPTGGDLTTTGFAGTSGANLFDLGNALSCHVRATCNTASATLTGMLVLYDASNAAIGITRQVAFNSDATLRLGNASGDFVSTHDIVDVGGARKARFFVKTVSAGTWAIYARPV